MPVSAHDVARELRERLRDPGVLKVHKLLYYCQGWHIAWTGEPMFEESIEAWANGPVVAEFWHDEDKGRGSPRPTTLDPSHLATIGYVLSRYGHLTGKELIALTHSESPWRAVSESDDPSTTRNPVVTHDSLRQYFSKEDDIEVDLRVVADRALADPVLRQAVQNSIERGKNEPGTPDDLDEIARLVSSHRT